jgi:hypothetical protein
MPPPPLPPLPPCLPLVEKPKSSSNSSSDNYIGETPATSGMEPASYYEKVMHMIKPAFETRQFIKNRTKRLKKKAELREQKAKEYAKKRERQIKQLGIETSPEVTKHHTITAADVAQSVASSSKQMLKTPNTNAKSQETVIDPKSTRAFGRQTWEDETLDEWVGI